MIIKWCAPVIQQWCTIVVILFDRAIVFYYVRVVRKMNWATLQRLLRYGRIQKMVIWNNSINWEAKWLMIDFLKTEKVKWWCHCCGTIVRNTPNKDANQMIVRTKCLLPNIRITIVLHASKTNAMFSHSTNIAGKFSYWNMLSIWHSSNNIVSLSSDIAKQFVQLKKVLMRYHLSYQCWSNRQTERFQWIQTVNWSYFVVVSMNFGWSA